MTPDAELLKVAILQRKALLSVHLSQVYILTLNSSNVSQSEQEMEYDIMTSYA